jgi:ribosomal protein S27E
VKSPFNFSFAALIRLYFPGLFFAALTFPVLSQLFKKIEFLAIFSKPEYIALEAVFWGILIYALDDTIYQIFEGRKLWPKFLYDRGIKNETAFINKCVAENNKLEAENKVGSDEYGELWYRLRVFPQDERSKYIAKCPTRLGNIIQGYELYSQSRYGIDAIFYGYRIWLTLDKNVKEKIDIESARADFAVYSSFLFYVSFLLHLLFCGFKLLQQILKLDLFSLPSWPVLLLLADVSLILGILFYMLSCPLHRFYGEYFKSLFDLHKNTVLELGQYPEENQRKRIDHATRFLQYHLIECPNHECGALNPGNAVTCEKCGTELSPVSQKSEIRQPDAGDIKESTAQATLLRKLLNLVKPESGK